MPDASQPERRQGVLTEGDFKRIGETFEDRILRLFESIGYDVSSQEKRFEIIEDHLFVRAARKARSKILSGFLTVLGALGSAAAFGFYIMWQAIRNAS